MGDAGVPQLHIGAGPGDALRLHGAVQLHHGGVVEPDTVEPLCDADAGDDAGGGLHRLLLPGEAGLVAVTADAAGAVAAHLAQGPVGVVEAHPVVAPVLGGVHHDEAVGPDGEMPLAEPPRQSGEGRLRQLLNQVVEDDEVVPGAVHFPEFHALPPLKALCPYYISTIHRTATDMVP